MATNIELKARLPNLPQAMERSLAMGARDSGLLVQTDTYFHVSAGRLKLRTIAGATAELIHYHRANNTLARASDYHILPISDPTTLLKMLTDALGVKIVVHKRRRLLVWENVRIHLDEVANLGTFLEFEAVVDATNAAEISRQRVDQLQNALDVFPEHLIADSYSDLVQAHSSLQRS